MRVSNMRHLGPWGIPVQPTERRPLKPGYPTSRGFHHATPNPLGTMVLGNLRTGRRDPKNPAEATAPYSRPERVKSHSTGERSSVW